MSIYLLSLMIPSPVFCAERRLGEKGIGWKEMMEARIGDHCMDHTDDGVDGDDWYERRVGMIGGNRMVVGEGTSRRVDQRGGNGGTSGPPRLSP